MPTAGRALKMGRDTGVTVPVTTTQTHSVNGSYADRSHQNRSHQNRSHQDRSHQVNIFLPFFLKQFIYPEEGLDFSSIHPSTALTNI